MESHIKLLGILHIIASALTLLGGLITLVVLGGIGGIAAMAGADSGDGDMAAAGVLTIIGIGIFVILLVVSLPGVICGWGILRFRPWAKTMGIVISAFDLLGFPFGTALGIYGLWVLTHAQTDPFFRRASVPAQ